MAVHSVLHHTCCEVCWKTNLLSCGTGPPPPKRPESSFYRSADGEGLDGAVERTNRVAKQQLQAPTAAACVQRSKSTTGLRRRRVPTLGLFRTSARSAEVRTGGKGTVRRVKIAKHANQATLILAGRGCRRGAHGARSGLHQQAISRSTKLTVTKRQHRNV